MRAGRAAMFGGDIKAAFSNWINTFIGPDYRIGTPPRALCNRAPHNIKSTSAATL
jgi:hypothetical protein